MELEYSQQNGQKLKIKEKSQISFIDISEILYLQCEEYLTTIYLVNKTSITTAKLLKEFEEELTKFGFLRVNHHTLVNPRHVSTLKIGNQRRVVCMNDIEIKISRRKFHLLKELLK
jgi:two-component system LytT family response regulator